MAYAEGVVIVGKRLQDAEEVLTSLMEKTNKMGLEINEKKTKCMTESCQPYNEYEHVKLGTYGFETVKGWDISW
jgi:hypothetical protein